MWLNVLTFAAFEAVSLPPSATGTVVVLYVSGQLGAGPAARSYAAVTTGNTSRESALARSS